MPYDGSITIGGRLMADWQKIKTEYITTNTSYRKLAQKYGVNYRTICARSKQEGWIEQREQHANKTTTQILNAVGKQQATRAAKLQTVADKLLGKIDALVEAWNPAEMDTQSVRHISATLKDLKDIQMIKSDADMREQEARIANLQKQADAHDDDKDKTVIVTIAGGEGAWQK
jgi:hypothetical protein